MKSWNGLRMRKIYEMNFGHKEESVELRAREILLNSSEIATAWEENSSTRLNEKLRIRENGSVNTRVLRNARKYAFMGQIVGCIFIIKMGLLNTDFCNMLIPGG
jgi:hypothetical protein